MKRVSVLMALLMMGTATFAEVSVQPEERSSVMVVVNDDYVGEYQFAEDSPIKKSENRKKWRCFDRKNRNGAI
ncbi:MAG: hypothetical protein LRY55_09590 [Leadbetterella sp.]|nr:hypothetical protein [Leadbetterella sp.]